MDLNSDASFDAVHVTCIRGNKGSAMVALDHLRTRIVAVPSIGITDTSSHAPICVTGGTQGISVAHGTIIITSSPSFLYSPPGLVATGPCVSHESTITTTLIHRL